MLDWEDLRHFLALARQGTLSAAARSLGVEHATVSRRVAHLEGKIGVRLIDKRGRRIHLTDEGRRIAAIAERMGDDVLTIERTTTGADHRLAGTVRISAPPAFASVVLAAPLVRLRRSHPGINIVVVGETRYASLNRREADIAVRLNRPDHGELTAVKIGEIVFGLYADRAYLAATEEADWTFIGYDEAMETSPQEKLLTTLAKGRPVAMRASTLEFQLAVVAAGGGVAVLPDFMVTDDRLQRMALPGDPLIRELWVVVHTDIKDVPLIRAVMNGLTAQSNASVRRVLLPSVS